MVYFLKIIKELSHFEFTDVDEQMGEKTEQIKRDQDEFWRWEKRIIVGGFSFSRYDRKYKSWITTII